MPEIQDSPDLQLAISDSVKNINQQKEILLGRIASDYFLSLSDQEHWSEGIETKESSASLNEVVGGVLLELIKEGGDAEEDISRKTLALVQSITPDGGEVKEYVNDHPVEMMAKAIFPGFEKLDWFNVLVSNIREMGVTVLGLKRDEAAKMVDGEKDLELIDKVKLVGSEQAGSGHGLVERVLEAMVSNVTTGDEVDEDFEDGGDIKRTDDSADGFEFEGKVRQFIDCKDGKLVAGDLEKLPRLREREKVEIGRAGENEDRVKVVVVGTVAREVFPVVIELNSDSQRAEEVYQRITGKEIIWPDEPTIDEIVNVRTENDKRITMSVLIEPEQDKDRLLTLVVTGGAEKNKLEDHEMQLALDALCEVGNAVIEQLTGGESLAEEIKKLGFRTSKDDEVVDSEHGVIRAYSIDEGKKWKNWQELKEALLKAQPMMKESMAADNPEEAKKGIDLQIVLDRERDIDEINGIEDLVEFAIETSSRVAVNGLGPDGADSFGDGEQMFRQTMRQFQEFCQRVELEEAEQMTSDWIDTQWEEFIESRKPEEKVQEPEPEEPAEESKPEGQLSTSSPTIVDFGEEF